MIFNQTKGLFRKIKNKGITGLINAVHVRLASLEYEIFTLCPLNNNLIVFESDGDLTDNSFALYEFMRNHGLLKKYTIVWMVHDVQKAKKRQMKYPDEFPHTKFANKDIGFNNCKRSFYLATCKWFIYDHSNLVSNYHRKKGQHVIYMSHGFGVKAGKGIVPVRNNFDINIVLGSIPAENAPFDWGGSISQTRQWGYPRNDYLFKDNYRVKRILNSNFSFDKYQKVILWMPTFRKAVSYGAALSEDYIRNETGMPLFNTLDELIRFDDFLDKMQILVVLKLHPLQADLQVFSFSFKNIKIVRNSDLEDLNIQLYQMVKYTDVLITDYSSISTDYMLLNQPIIYILDDYEEYKSARGLSPENAIDLLVGYHVVNVSELKTAIIEVGDGIDKFKEKRNVILPDLHKHIDGNACERIIEKLSL